MTLSAFFIAYFICGLFHFANDVRKFVGYIVFSKMPFPVFFVCMIVSALTWLPWEAFKLFKETPKKS